MSRLAGLLQLSNGHEDSPAGKQVEVGLHTATSALLLQGAEYVINITHLLSAQNKGVSLSAGTALVIVNPLISSSVD